MSQPNEDHLPHFRVRPRFQIETPHSIETLVEKIKTGLDKEDSKCNGWVNPTGYGVLFLPQEEQHYWSPQLSLTFEKLENGSLLRGLYGPRPAVWTMFIFFYFVIAFAALILTVIGFSNMYLGKSALILWLVPVLILTFCTLFLVAYLGQKLGHKQMVTLHHFMEESTGLVIQEE